MLFPFSFLFGSGGPNLGKKCKVEVSYEACLRHYMRLSLNQFVRSDFILVCYHLMCRVASYTMGFIKCRSNYQGKTPQERISKLSASDVHRAAKELKQRVPSDKPLQTS